MLTKIGPIDVSHRLFKSLRSSTAARNGALRVWDYGYDWRLSPHLLSYKLADFLEDLHFNRADMTADDRDLIITAHSLGGLITRHAVNQRPELFSGVLYVGSSVDYVGVLGPLRHPDQVLFSSDVLTPTINFTMRTGFWVLLDDGRCFVGRQTGKPLIINSFDPQSWLKYRLSPCVASPMPSFRRLRTVMGEFFETCRGL